MIGKVLNFHLPAGDVDRAAAFYRQVFGWTFTALSEVPPYLVFTTGGSDAPGIEGAIVKRDAIVQHPIPTIEVDDIDGTMARLSVSGGQQGAVRDIAGTGRFGYAIDSEGNVIALLQRAP